MAAFMWFHLVSLAICVVAITPTPYSASEQATMLSAHNNERSRFNNLPSLTWNAQAARVAQDYANRCTWGHNSARTNQYTTLVGAGATLGENIYASGGWVSGFPKAADSWVNEKFDYNCAANSCNSGKVCGHYTQVIWNGSTTLGCGRANCDINSPWSGIPQWTMVVCNYASAGNYVGQRAVADCSTGGTPNPPTAQPTVRPTAAPTAQPTSAPTQRPTAAPIAQPTAAPTQRPTAAPTAQPTAAPTQRPTAPPTAAPTPHPNNGLGYRKCYYDPGTSKLNYRYWFGSSSPFTLASCTSKCQGKSSTFTYYGFEKDTTWYYCVCFSSLPISAQVADTNCVGPYKDSSLPYSGNENNIAIYYA